MSSGREEHAGGSGPGYMPGAMDHQVNPRNAGAVEDPDGIGRVGDPRVGDFVEVTLRLDGDTIAAILFRVVGFAGATATASAVTCMVKGKGIREALTLTDDDVAAYLGGSPRNAGTCSLIGLKAMRAAVSDAILMNSLVRAGAVKDKSEYRRLEAETVAAGGDAHACDGSCGGAEDGVCREENGNQTGA